MESKELNHKAFNARNYDKYLYFLKLYHEFSNNHFNDEINFNFNFCDAFFTTIPTGFSDWSQINKVVYLMNLTHQLLDYGYREPSYLQNASPSVLLKKQSSNIRPNCINHAVVFNAFLLSNSIYSRCVWCMPMDIGNLEFHVVNSVYFPKINKWLFFDSSRNCFARNSSGELLSFYRIYLAKNMFRFGAFAESKYYQDEISSNCIFNILNPRLYYPTTGYKQIISNEKKIKLIYTDEEDLFWKRP